MGGETLIINTTRQPYVNTIIINIYRYKNIMKYDLATTNTNPFLNDNAKDIFQNTTLLYIVVVNQEAICFAQILTCNRDVTSSRNGVPRADIIL